MFSNKLFNKQSKFNWKIFLISELAKPMIKLSSQSLKISSFPNGSTDQKYLTFIMTPIFQKIRTTKIYSKIYIHILLRNSKCNILIQFFSYTSAMISNRWRSFITSATGWFSSKAGKQMSGNSVHCDCLSVSLTSTV